MEPQKMRKCLKLLTLLISSLLIATASAQIYNYMYIQGTGQVTTTEGLKWVLGADLPTPPPTIDGPTVIGLGLTTYDGTKRNYTDCLHLVNQDLSAHTFSIKVTTSSGVWTDFLEFNLVLFDDLGAEQPILDLKTQDNEITGLSISGSATWTVLFELIPIPAATGIPVGTFEVTLTYI